ncbi:MAG: hypothetical protein VCA55_02060 [Verrucomicrobiales bacterium]
MDHEADNFESSLREFSPAKVPDALQSRILEILDKNPEKGLHPATGTENIRKFHFLSPFATAAAILIGAAGVFFAVLNNIETNPATKPDAMAMVPEKAPFVPVHAENIFEGVHDEGLFLTSGKVPVQGVRYRFSDSFKWRNPQDGSVIEMTIPSERLFLLPVQTD